MSNMILKQYYLGCLSHASYLIGDEGNKTAVIVDPQRDIEQYVEDARLHGLSIRHVFLTHFHADFIAGHLELKQRFSARIYLGSQAKAEYEFTPLEDGDAIEFGKVRLEILETPGHSPESISILVYDLTKDTSEPRAVLTGDTLFIGDVGRPDLRASLGWTADELGGMLYDSIQNKLLVLPDDTLVYPTHGAGSMCGKQLSKDTVSTMGVQKKYNYALQPMSKEKFVEIVTAEQPDAPDYFIYDAVLNTKERLTLNETMSRNLTPLTLGEVLKLKDEGVQILDVRNLVDYEGAHLYGSINIGLDGSYATWAGTILDSDKTIVIISSPGLEEEAVMRLGRIGFDYIAGYLQGGMEALLTRPDILRRTERITVQALSEMISSDDPPQILDVRRPGEWELSRIEGSVNIPLNHLNERYEEIPNDKELVVHCASGYRSSIAVSLLEKNNFTNVSDLVGGITAWEAANLNP
jgi:hydroxyacylglutathione hydrolase